MSKIELMEVNQHTSDEVTKVLEELEAQGVDITAIKDALANSGGAVKSVQRGVITMNNSKNAVTATIKAVNMEKSSVFYCGATVPSEYHSMMPYLVLTNSTTVTANTHDAPNTTYVMKVSFAVIEFV